MSAAQAVQIFPPSGPHAVGTALLDLPREGRAPLEVQLWYPARKDASAPFAPYLLRPQTLEGGFLPTAVVEAVKDAPTSARLNAPPLGGPWPLVLFSHGLTGFPAQSTFLTQELASHGSVVAGVDHRFRYEAEGLAWGRSVGTDLAANVRLHDELAARILPRQVQALRDALAGLASSAAGALTGRLDFSRLGALGHSFGGATALAFAQDDERCRAAVGLDPTMTAARARQGIAKPFMLVTSLDALARDAELSARAPALPLAYLRGAARQQAEVTDALFAASSGPAFRLRLAGSGHLDYSDAPLLAPAYATPGFDARRGFRVISDYLLAFFGAFLRDKPSPLLRTPSPAHPEMRFVPSPERAPTLEER